MAAELQPPEPPITTAETTTTATAPESTAVMDPSETNNQGPAAAAAAPKRQRRPSVRLGEIGDQPATLSFDSHVRRTKLPWRLPKDSSKKARSITNLVNGNHNGNQEVQEHESGLNGDVNLEFGQLRRKAKRITTKRVRTNWVLKGDDVVDGGGGGGGGGNEGGDSGEGGEEGFRELGFNSDSPVWHGGHRNTGAGSGRGIRVSEEDDVEMEVDNNLPDFDWKFEGVRQWLIRLGLSRYVPVFEIHEVDDEVLPLLTLEDLKDMGISAVGSRRKLYSAIQKLRKGFS